MKCCLKINMKFAVRLLCAVLLVMVVVGDVATLLYGYRYSEPAGEGWFGAQLLCGGVVLFSVLVLPILAYFLPIGTSKLSQLWFAMHVTMSDDWARHAMVLLYNLQVQPVVDAFGLTSIAADLKDANYWWWFAQGFLLTALVRCLVSFDAEDDSVEEESEEVMEVVVSDSRHDREPEASVALAGPQAIYSVELSQLAVVPVTQGSTTITIEEIG